MSLKLLSGPYTVVDGNGDPISASSGPRVNWIDARGLLVGDSPRRLVQLDGTADLIGTSRADEGFGLQSALAILNRNVAGPDIGERWYAAVETQLGGGVRMWAANKVTLLEEEYLTNEIPANSSGSHRLLVHDRALRIRGATTATIYAATSAAGGWVQEATISGMSTLGWASWADDAREIWVADFNGRVCRYDIVAKQRVGNILSIGMSCIGLFWSRKFGIFLSLHFVSGSPSTWQIRTWALEIQPASIAVPSASPGLSEGATSTLTTRVLGAASDPCVGELVAWSASAGSLSQAATYTDADGYATTELLVPLGESGPIDVDVEVAY